MDLGHFQNKRLICVVAKYRLSSRIVSEKIASSAQFDHGLRK